MSVTHATPAGAAPALDPAIAARLKRDANGLIAAVAQQWDTGEVLMLGWMDDEALRRTLESGRATYFSRSRQEYWAKGDTSGHRQWVRSVALDCDGDALLVKVDQEGPACHTGTRTCFDERLLPGTATDCDERGTSEEHKGAIGTATDCDERGTSEEHKGAMGTATDCDERGTSEEHKGAIGTAGEVS